MSALEVIIQAVLALFGVGYLAVSVWLVIRLVKRRSRWTFLRLPAWVLGIPALYIASIAPIIWMDSGLYFNEDGILFKACTSYMTPVRLACDYGPASAFDAYRWYARLLVPDAGVSGVSQESRELRLQAIHAAFSAMTIAYAAVFLWLAVRVINRRERWARWSLSFTCLPILYIGLYGPACWASSHCGAGGRVVSVVYQPLFVLKLFEGGAISNCLSTYEQLLAKDGWSVLQGPDGLVWTDYESLVESLNIFFKRDVEDESNSPSEVGEPAK